MGRATSSGNISGASGHVSGKFAVKSSGVHASYDLYNNGTTYLNGAAIIDDALNLTGSNAKLQVGSTTVISSTRRLTPTGIQMSPDTGLYATDATLSYYSASNAVYLNGAGPSGWLRLNASGTHNDRTAINLFGATAGDYITFKTNSTERMRLASNGDWVVSNTNPRVVSQFTNQAGIGWYDADLHAEIATTGNRSALELGRNNSTATGDFLTFRKQATVTGSIGIEGGDSLFIQTAGSSGSGLRFHPTSGVISPMRNSSLSSGTISLGTGTQRFKNLAIRGIDQKQEGQIGQTPTASNFGYGHVFENSGSTDAYSIGYAYGGYFSFNRRAADGTYMRMAYFTSSGRFDVNNDIRTDSRVGVGSTGTTGAPAIYRNGDTDTGIYWPNTNQIGLVAGGSRKFYINTTTAYFQNLSNGVLVNASSNDTSASMGNQTPQLYVDGYTSLGGLRIKGTDSGNTIYKSGSNLGIKVGSAADSIDFGIGGGTHFSITSSGNANIQNGKSLPD